jgi:hypothetical protein
MSCLKIFYGVKINVNIRAMRILSLATHFIEGAQLELKKSNNIKAPFPGKGATGNNTFH